MLELSRQKKQTNKGKAAYSKAKYVMKKIILMMIVISSIALHTTAKPKIHITVGFTIGKASKNCEKFGLCKVTIDGDKTMIKGGLDLDEDAGTLTITLSESDLIALQHDKLFYFQGQNYITFDEIWICPEEISNALGSRTSLIVNVGKYPLSYNNGVYSITISL